MPYFHATFRRHLPSIQRRGLLPEHPEQNWEGIETGVYLADNPAICVMMMLEQYATYGAPDSVPKDHLQEIVVIVIDDSRIDARKLARDLSVEHRPDVHRYLGVIDVTGMPVLSVDDLQKEFAALPN